MDYWWGCISNESVIYFLTNFLLELIRVNVEIWPINGPFSQNVAQGVNFMSSDERWCVMQVWIFKIGIGRLQYEFEQVCDSSGEDPSCSRWLSQFFVVPCNVGSCFREHLMTGIYSHGVVCGENVMNMQVSLWEQHCRPSNLLWGLP